MAVSGTTHASRRHVVFGLNALVQVAVAAVLVVGVVWLAGRPQWQVDTTRSGVNSLSPRTRQLLGQLDQNVRITAVFPEPDKRNTLALKRRGQIRDQLDLYERAGGGRVSTYLLDPSLQKNETDQLLKRLTALPAYKDEAKPHEEALAKFPAVNESIRALAGEDARKIKELAKGQAELTQDRNLAIVWNNLNVIEQEAAQSAQDVDELRKGDVPRYTQAVQKVREYLGRAKATLEDALKWMKGDALSLPGSTPDLQLFFRDGPGRYEPVLQQITSLEDTTKNLKEVKLETLYNELMRWRTRDGQPVLVEGGKEARVVRFEDIWPQLSDPNAPVGPDGDDREFAGEASISSAILQLTQKTKTAVVFVRFGGESPLEPDFSRMNMMMMQQMPRAPYQELNRLLGKANFVTKDWDVAQSKVPPTVPDAGRTVYVVLPPEPPQRPSPMQPTPPPRMTPADCKIVEDAVQAAGAAVFLAGWKPPASPIPGMNEPYEYGEYLKNTWGVEVQSDLLALLFMPNPEKPGLWYPARMDPRGRLTVVSMLTTDDGVRFTNQAIGQALRTDRAAFSVLAPLKIVATATQPAGVKVETVAEVGPTEDIWACSDLHRLDTELKQDQGTRRGEGDLAAPFPIAVAATKEVGAATSAPASQPQTQRVVVFGSQAFALDDLAQASTLQQVGNRLAVTLLYPANADLFIKALHWLTGEADRVAVGPRRGDLPRLSGLNETWAGILPWFLVGVWPALALVAGVGMWVVRRR
jgi:hypothetical protein